MKNSPALNVVTVLLVAFLWRCTEVPDTDGKLPRITDPASEFGQIDSPTGPSLRVLSCSDGGGYLSIDFNEANCLDLGGYTTISTVDCPYEFRGETLAVDLASWAKDFGTDLWYYPNTFSALFTPYGTTDGIKGSWLFVGYDWDTFDTTGEDWDVLTGHNALTAGYTVWEITQTAVYEYYTLSYAAMFVESWESTCFGALGCLTDLYDITVLAIDSNTIRMTGRTTGEVVTIAVSATRDFTYSSSDPWHTTATLYDKPASCPNRSPSWYTDEFLRDNRKTAPIDTGTGDTTTPSGPGLRVLSYSDGGGYLSIVFNESNCLELGGLTAIDSEDCPYEFRGETLAVDLTPWADNFGTDLWYYPNTFSALFTPTVTVSGIEGTWLFVGYDYDTYDTTGEDWDVLTGHNALTNGYTVWEITQTAIYEYYTVSCAAMFIESWESTCIGQLGCLPDFYDIILTAIDSNTVRMTGLTSGEVVTMAFLPGRNTRYSSTNPAHTTATLHDKPTSCPNELPSWYLEGFLADNTDPAMLGKRRPLPDADRVIALAGSVRR